MDRRTGKARPSLRTSQRSVVFDLFGDYIRYSGGQIKLAGLTALLSDFGIEPPTVRVVMSRLRKEGWLDTSRDGRETIYALNDRSYQLLDEGRARIFRRPANAWAGRWTMVIYQVPESDRATRERLRKKLAWLGFGQLSSSTWISPHDLFAEVKTLATTESAAAIDLLQCETDDLDVDRRFASRCWDLEQLSLDYTEFIAQYDAMDAPEVNARKEGRTAFLERMSIIRDFRRFPFRDPQLPRELQPANWPGPRAYQMFDNIHHQLVQQANTYVSGVIGRPINGPPLLVK